MNEGNASILIVDDRPEKLLALEAVLEDLDQTIVRAHSGRDALRQVLAQDFAVILLDVNMPGMDGFETASLIRQRKSSAHVPIIFITAFGDEMHAARGYSLGAVDYILAPVIPEVLRTKVGVFVDLFRKSQQLRRQADWLRSQAEQLHKLTAASLAINSALSVDQMLQVVTDTGRQIIGAHQAGATAVLGAGRNRIVRVATFSEKFAGAHTCCSVMESTEAWQTLQRSGQPMRLTQPEIERMAVWQETPDPMRIGLPTAAVFPSPPMRGWLAAPLTSRDGHNMGLIQLSDRYDGDFTNDDEAILVQLSQMASIALDNSLYSEEREANRIKDEFLATLSHELRTPLNAILGWTQLLRSEDGRAAPADADELSHGLEVIERNARSQAKLIEDLLDVSRITTGKMRLNVRPTEMGKIVLAAADVVRPAAEAKQIKVECQLDADAAASMIAADPDRLQQVFWNLLSNAAKFTPSGGRITCELKRNGEEVILRVTDTGSGIDPKFLPCVFDRFRQADSSSTRSQGGLGIGLTIVRHIVELHGGTVRAESAGEGTGSTFTVTLPVATATQTPETAVLPLKSSARPGAEAPHMPSDVRGLRVLLVDDDADAREVVREFLIRGGAEVATAASAAEGMIRLEEYRPHILLSDIAMPEEDGYAFVQRVRNLPPEAGGAVPAIALSAYARDEDRRKSLQAGFQAHLAKPVEPQELLSTLARWAQDFSPSTEQSSLIVK
jgi:signal transduction histidine kinase/DNA-binding response OmpR family regulator